MYVVRSPGRRAHDQTDIDELRDRLQEQDNAHTASSKRQARFDRDRWESAGLILEAIHPSNNLVLSFQDIPANREGEYTYRIRVANLVDGMPLWPKPSSVLAERALNLHGLLATWGFLSDRFTSDSKAWLDQRTNVCLQQQVCVALFAGHCNDANCGGIHPTWTESEISTVGAAAAHRMFLDRSPRRFVGPIASSGENKPRGDGLGLAHLMAQQTGPGSIDDNRRNVLSHFKRAAGTPRRQTRHETANPQTRVPPTGNAAAAAANVPVIESLTGASRTWRGVRHAAATGVSLNVAWSPDPNEVQAEVQAMVDLFQRVASTIERLSATTGHGG